MSESPPADHRPAGAPPPESPQRPSGVPLLRGVALVEAAKGLLVLLAGAGLLSLTPQQVEVATEAMLHSFRLNPSSGYPRVFMDLASQTSNAELWWLAAGALAYSLIRFAEAYGLWRDRTWAKWLGALSGAIYIPYEIYGLMERAIPAMAGLLALNLVIVGLLAWSLWSSGRRGSPPVD